MPSEKISQLAPITAVASGDYFPVVTAAATENKRVDIGVLDDRYASSSSASEALASGNAALVDAAAAQSTADAAQGSATAVEAFAQTRYAISGGLIDGAQSTNVIDLGLNGQYVCCASGNYFKTTLSGTYAASFDLVPSGSYGFTLELAAQTGAITWPGTVAWPSSTAPTVDAGTVNILVFVTDNQGSTWRGSSIIGYP
jgi:hypothetical protein